jgi:hypothetical protein
LSGHTGPLIGAVLDRETLMDHSSRRTLLVVVLAAQALWLSPAFAAPDAREVADALAAAASATGRVKATYDDATAAGDVVTISGFKVVRTDAKTVTIPSVVVTEPITRNPGGFTAKSIAFDGGTAKRGEDLVSWNTGMIEEAVIPSPDEIKAETDFRPFGKLIVSGLTISESNLAKPISASEIRVVMDSDSGGHPTAFAAQITGIQFGAEVLADRPQEKAIVDALGYEEFDVNVNVAGSFDRERDAMTLETLTINTVDVGTVSINARLSGVSAGQIAATRLDSEAQSNAKLNSLEIRFDNAGVVERALDMHAALIWGTRADAIAQVNAALPLVLNFIGNDGFQARTAAAFKAFFDNPQSISFSATPAEPVSLEAILNTSRGGLKGLPDLLGADVSAN